MTDHLARVAAIAERERAKATDKRAAMRAQHPELVHERGQLRGAFGADAIHAVTIGVTRYGREPLPFRRSELTPPPMPPFLTLRLLKEAGDAKIAAVVDAYYGQRG